MKVSINNTNDLVAYSQYIPFEAKKDIEKRITDWLASGGDIEDAYIQQQFRYAENIIKGARK